MRRLRCPDPYTLVLLALVAIALAGIFGPVIRDHPSPRPRLERQVLQRNSQNRLLAARPVLGGVPTVVAEKAAWGVSEVSRQGHACRITLGLARGDLALRLDVVRDGTADCTMLAAEAADVLKKIGR